MALLSRAAHPLHPPGGLERAVYHLAHHLQRQGIDTTLFTRPATERAEFPGEVVTVPYGSSPLVAHGRVLDRTLHYPRFASILGEAVVDRVRRKQIDVVHAQGLTALGYARAHARDASLRAPLVMNPQGMEEHKTRGLKRLALSRLRKLSCEAALRADRVIATDESTRHEVSELLGVPAQRIVVLPNGVDLDELQNATPDDAAATVRKRYGLQDATPLLLSIGRLEGYKGFGDVQRALEKLASSGRLPEAARWVVVGEGPARPTLEAGALGTRQRLLGRVDEASLQALYEAADVFIHAPHFEGSSLVTLEAMAHRLPVVVTRAGGIRDKVDHETGRVVEPRDVAALALAIDELSTDAALRSELGDNARRRVEQSFAWPAIARRTIRLYEELLADRAA